MATNGSHRADPEGPGGLEDRIGRVLGREPGRPPDLDALFAGLSGELQRERGLRAWLRARSTGVRVGLVVLCVLLLAAVVVVGWRRPDYAVYPPARMAISLALVAAWIALTLRLALRPLHRAPPAPWIAPVAIAGAVVGVLALSLLPAAHVDHPASLQAPGTAALLRRALPCLATGLAVAAGCYALVRALDRGGTAHALLAAACASLVAYMTLKLHCPITAPSHLLAGHASAALLGLGLALLFRRDE